MPVRGGSRAPGKLVISYHSTSVQLIDGRISPIGVACFHLLLFLSAVSCSPSALHPDSWYLLEERSPDVGVVPVQEKRARVRVRARSEERQEQPVPATSHNSTTQPAGRGSSGVTGAFSGEHVRNRVRAHTLHPHCTLCTFGPRKRTRPSLCIFSL